MTRTGSGDQIGVAEARPEAVMRHHRAAWRLERVAWGVMALLLLATLLGAFGGGPLSHARSSAGPASLEYERLMRAAAPTVYRLRVEPAMAANGRVPVRIDQALVDLMQLQSIVPQPESVTAGPGYTEFVFRVDPGRQLPAEIVFRFQPATFGRFRGQLLVAGRESLPVSHVVYP